MSQLEGAPGRFRAALGLVAGNLVVLLVGIILLELAFGSWRHPDRMAELHVPSACRLQYDASFLYPTQEKVLYQRDRFGLRGSYPSLGQIDILTVGGSTTDQRYLTEGKTWQDVIARRFAQAGHPLSVVNAGVDGQSSIGHLRDFEAWFPNLPGLNVSYFLFYLGYNDVFIDENFDAQDTLRQGSWAEFVASRSALCRLSRTVQGMIRARQCQVGHGACKLNTDDCIRSPLLHGHRELFARRLAVYRRNVEGLVDRVQKLGSTAILVTQTCRWYKRVDGVLLGNPVQFQLDGQTLNGLDVYYLLDAINQVTLEVAKQRGALAIDLAKEMEWEDSDFYDLAHNTPSGAEKVGDFLYRNLSRLSVDRPR